MCIYIILLYIYLVVTDRRHCCDKYAEAAKEKNGTKAQHASASDAGPRPSTSVKAVKSYVQCIASLDPWMVTLVPWSKLD